mmetsp:Transcript_111751/g.312371  ORF Transcript_111751/g.312371 Transcript_111751/m.312371 type:complete len:230 (+) Transcript_111751:388-1077(+)
MPMTTRVAIEAAQRASGPHRANASEATFENRCITSARAFGSCSTTGGKKKPPLAKRRGSRLSASSTFAKAFFTLSRFPLQGRARPSLVPSFPATWQKSQPAPNLQPCGSFVNMQGRQAPETWSAEPTEATVALTAIAPRPCAPPAHTSDKWPLPARMAARRSSWAVEAASATAPPTQSRGGNERQRRPRHAMHGSSRTAKKVLLTTNAASGIAPQASGTPHARKLCCQP